MTKREKILLSAIDCFTVNGYQKTTMSDIGKRVGLNKASLYYHFKDKLTLYGAVLQHLRNEHDTNLNKNLDTITDFNDKITYFISEEINFIRNISINQLTNPSEEQSSDVETKNLSEENNTLTIKFLSSLLKSGIDNKYYSEFNHQDIAVLIFKMYYGLLLVDCPLKLPLSKRFEQYEAVKQESTILIRLILNGLK